MLLGDLLKLAQEKVHDDGYIYKKGKSRSKRSSSSSVSDPPQTKRTKIDTQERQARINDLLEQITDIDKRIEFKQRRIDTATATRNFKTCYELSEEVSELKSRRRELNCELGPLQKKAKKSSWYFQRKEKCKETQAATSSSLSQLQLVADPVTEKEVSDEPFFPPGLPAPRM